MSASSYSVGVIGGGSWGTALAVLANRAGSKVTLATRNRMVLETILERRINETYLPSVYIDPSIILSDKLTDTCTSNVLIIAVPSHQVRAVCIAISDSIDKKIPIVIASKGIERGSLMLMSEVSQAILPHNPVGILSGPNFADEAAKGLPAATTIASKNPDLLDLMPYAIGGRMFRPYLTDDIIGAQIGGAVKNVIAIACGIAVGRGLGENARAALVTRGFAEITRLALAKGARAETLHGLSGLGDLLLTCGSVKSRNFSFGVTLAHGQSKDEILSERGRTATEGVLASETVTELARGLGVHMPICEAVYHILYKNMPIDGVVSHLMERPFVSEVV